MSSATVSTRWYFTDWLSDPNLRSCSLGARGLWMDMLCIAATNKGKDHGFVMIADRIPTTVQIARLLGSTDTEVTELIKELEINKVFNRDRRGAIYSRRMVRAEKSRANGRLSGEINERSGRLGTFRKPIETKENKNQGTPPIPEPEPKPKIPPLPPEGVTAEPDGKRKREKTRCRIPADAVIGDKDLAFAVEQGFDERRAAALFESFRDHHRGKGNMMADWAAAWRTWVRNEIKFSNKGGLRSGTDRKVGFSGIAARIRYGGGLAGGECGPDRPGPEDMLPLLRR